MVSIKNLWSVTLFLRTKSIPARSTISLKKTGPALGPVGRSDAASWYTMQSAVYLDWGRVEEARQVLERAPRTDDRILLCAWGTWSPTQAITRRRCVVWARHE